MDEVISVQISRKELDCWCEDKAEEHYLLLKQLAAIPAPSHHEQKRAEFIQKWLLSNGPLLR